MNQAYNVLKALMQAETNPLVKKALEIALNKLEQKILMACLRQHQ